MGRTVSDRFWKKVRKEPNGCWIWTGSKARGGYGKFWDGERTVMAHHRAYEYARGPLPYGLVLTRPGMHEEPPTCSNACVNPDHLKAVTKAESARMSPRFIRAAQANARKMGLARRRDDLPVGVYVNGRRLQVRLWHGGHLYHIGMFDSAEEASDAYIAARCQAEKGELKDARSDLA